MRPTLPNLLGLSVLLTTASTFAQPRTEPPILDRTDARRWEYAITLRLTAADCEDQALDEFVRADGPATSDRVYRIRLVPIRPIRGRLPERPEGTPLRPIDISPAQRFRLRAETASFLWPVTERSASHQTDPYEGIDAELWIDSTQLPLRRRTFEAYADGSPLHSGAAWADWYTGPIDADVANIELRLRGRAIAYSTVFDEASARRIDWPTGSWPEEAASTFEPMLLTDHDAYGRPYEPESVKRLAKELTRGRERSQPPVVAAKWIAGELARRFQFDRSGMEYCSIAADRFDEDTIEPTLGLNPGVGVPVGFNAVGTQAAADTLRGSPVDLSLLLARVYREIGIPARIVVGWRIFDPQEGDSGGAIDDQPLGLHVWVEFALLDERESAVRDDQRLVWVPVDVLEIRRGGAFSRGLNTPWPGFGTVAHLNRTIPLGFHLAPHRMGEIWYGGSTRPAMVRDVFAAAPEHEPPRPLIYGWNVVPNTPGFLTQQLSASVWESPVTSGQRPVGE
ncbi:MAG: transglutaminase domain-containing protein [Phycisphaerales bacterium]